jgi:DNA-binding CsgD family transcriptional regulator
MSRSQRLRLKDVRDAYRLIGECREVAALSEPGRPWWRHMLAGLCPLVGAQVGIAGVFRHFATPRQQILAVEELGWSGRAERAHFLRYQADGGERRDPVFQQFAGQLDAPLVTRSREQLLADRCWHNSTIYNEYLKPAGIDGKIMSLCALPGNKAMSHLLTLKRPPGQREFEPRELRLVHLFHHELNEVLGTNLVSPAPAAAEALPPRLRQVLACLLAGDSEQQVALQLGISPHTVHEHVKRLHRRFGVASRGELLACLLTRGQKGPVATPSAEMKQRTPDVDV